MPSFIQIANRLQKVFSECNFDWLLHQITKLEQHNIKVSIPKWNSYAK